MSCSDCVCCGVCTDLDVCVPLEGCSDELWKFSTSTLGWKRVDNTDGPSARYSHVMTSVGLDLWVHGSSCTGESDIDNVELWRFSTSTFVWTRIEVDGARPRGRSGYVMTTVGLDLWVHGGWTGEDDACATRAALLLLLR